jgi:hypothetical protein
MPMVSLKFSGWEAIMKERISREIEERVAAESAQVPLRDE